MKEYFVANDTDKETEGGLDKEEESGYLEYCPLDNSGKLYRFFTGQSGFYEGWSLKDVKEYGVLVDKIKELENKISAYVTPLNLDVDYMLEVFKIKNEIKGLEDEVSIFTNKVKNFYKDAEEEGRLYEIYVASMKWKSGDYALITPLGHVYLHRELDGEMWEYQSQQVYYSNAKYSGYLTAGYVKKSLSTGLELGRFGEEYMWQSIEEYQSELELMKEYWNTGLWKKRPWWKIPPFTWYLLIFSLYTAAIFIPLYFSGLTIEESFSVYAAVSGLFLFSFLVSFFYDY